MEQAIQHGADIIIRDWVRLRAGERILIVSSQKYAVEVAAMQQAAQAVGSVADVLMLDDLHEQVGQYFDDREDAFDPYNAVIGAAEYSLITTRAVKRVIARRNRFLSLPLSTSNGQSLLSYDFLNMSLPKSRIMASIIMACYQNASHIHVTTELGTNLDFNIEGRVPGFFNGNNLSLYGNHTVRIVEEFFPSKAFISCAGILPDGRLADTSMYETDTKRAFIGKSERVYLLADSGKFNRTVKSGK